MPEETEDFIHIPVKDKNSFEEGSYRTINISAAKGIKAVIGKLKGESSTTVQKYLFAKDKGWTMSKAKKWLKDHKKKAVANIGEIEWDINFTSQFECIDVDNISSLKELKRLGIDVKEGEIYTKGTAFISDINRNSWRTGIKEMDTENYMLTPITLFNHNVDIPVGKTIFLKKTKDSLEVITKITTSDEEMRGNIENGTINAHSIRIRPYAVERVCLENNSCFYDVLSCELLEVSYVTVNAVVGTNFEVLSASYSDVGEIKNITDQNGTLQTPSMTTADTTWGNVGITTTWPVDTGNGVDYNFELDDNINVTQIIVDKEEKDKVKLMENETPEPSTDIERVEVDLSSTENNDELLAKLDEVLEIKNALKAEQAKLKEQNLDHLVKKTMTLFESVENKADIKPQLVAIVENGGEVALTATIEIIKIVMESKLIKDESLTDSGGDGMNSLDKQSVEDLGATVPDMVARIMEEHKRKEAT